MTVDELMEHAEARLARYAAQGFKDGSLDEESRAFMGEIKRLRAGGTRGRVRVLTGWEREGRTGRVLGPDVTPPGCVTWTPVLWDDEEDPDWHKASGLVAIPEDAWSSPGAPSIESLDEEVKRLRAWRSEVRAAWERFDSPEAGRLLPDLTLPPLVFRAALEKRAAALEAVRALLGGAP